MKPITPDPQIVYRAGGVVFRPAGSADDAALRRCLRDNDMDAWIKLAFEREPCFFDGENLMGASLAVIAEAEKLPHDFVGMYTCAQLPVHLNGQTAVAGYLGGLRVNPSYRRKIRILRDGFASIPVLTRPWRQPNAWFTSIGQENNQARRVLEAGLKHLPRYLLAGEMETLVFPTRLEQPTGLLQAATREDIPALSDFFNQQAQAFQFAPRLDEAWLRSLDGTHGLCLADFWLLKDGDVLHGCLAIWDQRRFKQTVVRSYRFPLNKLRVAYNLLAGIRGKLKLPAPNQQIEQVFLSFVALSESAQDNAVAVVKEGLRLAAQKGALVGTLGLSAQSPLNARLKAVLPHESYRTRIETVSWANAESLALYGRPVQPEVALL
ncbi:MAG: hypothetical protein PHI11_07015 [Gallionella sp.]|nr:hypothetical protein [Gallionella sp.]